VRLTLAFALAMTVLLGLAGVFLYVQLGRALDDSTEAETLESLLAGLLALGPVVVALSSLAAYRLAARALAPVEAMRREAEAVSALEPGRRLAVPETRDEVARLAATLNEMLERLDAALERERRIVADAGHELRLPLSALRAELELALAGERSREELVAAVGSALDETERLSRLADDLLVLARAEDGALPMHLETIGVESLLARVSDRHRLRAESLHRLLAVDAADGLVVQADRLRLEQALGNLVDNALLHGAGDVVLRARATNGRVELHVLDGGGAGIDPTLVEPFARGDPRRPGAGLGLAIVQLIARSHGGALHLGDVEGRTDVWLDVASEERPSAVRADAGR
jgi:signal transduction histidine kinase